MPKRKQRLRVVFDTNVLIRHFISHSSRKQNFNRRVFELWFIKSQIQLIISSEIIEEYVEVMRVVLGISENILKKWRERFSSHNADLVSPGRRYAFSRDPKDNIFLAVAAIGKADFLITNDTDLLEISEANKRKLKFKIITPKQFTDYWDSLN